MSKFKSKLRPPKKYGKKRAPIGSQTAKRFKSFSDRKSERRAKLGRQTEDRVALLLEEKKKQGELISFVKHPANSPEDHAGKDFTVSMLIEGEPVTASFGVTISSRQLEINIPLIVIPPEMSDERIWYRICKICESANNK